MTRLLVFGDATGDVAGVFAKANAIVRKSGPFSAVIFAGGLASSESDFSKGARLVVPGYFAAQVFNGSETRTTIDTANVTYVGPAAFEVIDGLRIFFLADGYDDTSELGSTGPLPEEVEVALRSAREQVDGKDFIGTDVFVGSRAPQSCHGAPSKQNTTKKTGLVERIGAAVLPRYHFYASAAKYTVLRPFVCPGAMHGTRVIGIAPSASSKLQKGEKWVYAVGMVPLAKMSPKQVEETRPSIPSPCIYVADTKSGSLIQSNGLKRHSSKSLGENDQYFWTMGGKDGKTRERVRKRPRVTVETPADAACWFCLGHAKDPHLVVSIGEHVYLALAKGGILPEHVLIIPKAHLRHSLDIRLTSEVFKEIARYKEALGRMFTEEMGHTPYYFERALVTRGGQAQMHMHIHAIPIRKAEAEKSSDIANEQAKRCQIKLIEPPENETCLSYIRNLAKGDETVNFFWAEFPDGVKAVQVFKSDNGLLRPVLEVEEKGEAHHNSNSREGGTGAELGRHPLHFGRSIGAAMLRRMDRTDWKRCVLPVELEKINVERFKKRFASYDPCPKQKPLVVDKTISND